MKFFRDSDEKAYDKVRKRLSRVSVLQVRDWANTTLWTVQEGLEHSDDRAALEQARTGTVALLASIDTLLDRTDLT